MAKSHSDWRGHVPTGEVTFRLIRPCLVTRVLPLRVTRVIQQGRGRRLPHSRSLENAPETLIQRIKDLVAHMLKSPAMWDAVVRFAEDVMSAKEKVERHGQRDEGVAQSRRWGAGRRRWIASKGRMLHYVRFILRSGR